MRYELVISFDAEDDEEAEFVADELANQLRREIEAKWNLLIGRPWLQHLTRLKGN